MTTCWVSRLGSAPSGGASGSRLRRAATASWSARSAGWARKTARCWWRRGTEDVVSKKKDASGRWEARDVSAS